MARHWLSYSVSDLIYHLPPTQSPAHQIKKLDDPNNEVFALIRIMHQIDSGAYLNIFM